MRATRRNALFGGLCLCCLPAIGRAREATALEEVGQGVFVRRGLDAEATADNNDAIANIGFIVGNESVLVTDPGGSMADGEWLRGEIAKRTDKPIRYVVLTHVHPDHCFGAEAFKRDGATFIGHHALRSALASRGDFYRERLVALLGEDKTGNVVMPTIEVKDTAQIDLGGRRISFTAHGTAHTNCDLSMIDHGSNLLFPADLLFVHRVPSLDGSLLGWLKEIDGLKALGATRCVPGHGPPSVEAASAFADLSRYLSLLRDETRKAISSDVPIEKAMRIVARSEQANWVMFDEYNARNVAQAYKELEWE